MDPLSITAGVLTLLTVSIKVSVLVKQFGDEVDVVDLTLTGLLGDIANFQQVLESMRDTFEQDDIKANIHVTGHAGNHWKNLGRSLEDGTRTLKQLTSLLESINKTTSFLDGPRKQLRLKGAIAQIGTYRDQIQSYRAALQLSLSTIILWNQVSFQKSTDQLPEKILPTLDKLYEEFRSLGTSLNTKIENLRVSVELQHHDNSDELKSMKNLRECVRSAADVVSTASSTLTVDAVERTPARYGSDFGDVFIKDTNETMLRWMSSNTVHEYDEILPYPDPSEASIGDAITEYHSDSDSDIETEMIKALFTMAKKLKKEGDAVGAERKLRNCLTRLSAKGSTASLTSLRTAAASSVSRLEILELLLDIYCASEAWAKAKDVMTEKLFITERQVGKTNEIYLWDNLKLADLMAKANEYDSAHLQGRRSLRGFKKLGEAGYRGYEQCGMFLIMLCKNQGRPDEEEAYAALLGNHQTKMAGKNLSTNADNSSIAPAVKDLATSTDNSVIAPANEDAPTSADDSAIAPAVKDPATGTDCSVIARRSPSIKDNQVDAKETEPRSSSEASEEVKGAPGSGQQEVIANQETNVAPTEVDGLLQDREMITTAASASGARTDTPDETISNTRNEDTKPLGTAVVSEGSRRVSDSLNLRSNIPVLEDLVSTLYLSGPVHSQLRKASVDGSWKDGLLERYCQLKYGSSPYFTISQDGLRVSCTIKLGSTASHTGPTCDTERAARDLAVLEACKIYIPPSIEESLCKSEKIRDPYSDKEVVPDVHSSQGSGFETNNTARQFSKTVVPDGSIPNRSKPQIIITPDVGKSNVPTMSSLLFRRSMPAIQSSFDTTTEVASPGTFLGQSSPASPPGMGWHWRTASDNGHSWANPLIRKTLHAAERSIRCPVCNKSLANWSEAAKSAHVNSCLDGTLQGQAGVSPTDMVSPDRSSTESGVWACSQCKSEGMELLKDICSTCQRRYSSQDPSSLNNFQRRPFDQFRTIITSLDPELIKSAENSFLPLQRKIFLMGDAMCGKTWLACAWSGRTLQRSTSIWDTAAFVRNVTVEGWSREFEVNVYDFPGEENLSRTRRGLYLNVRVLLICFDISNIDSLENVQEMWAPEADKHMRDIPRILVGCKKDLRGGSEEPSSPLREEDLVSPYKAERIAHEIGALAYFETSATKREGLDELFEYMAEVSVSMTKPVAKKDWGVRRFLSRS